MASAAVGTLAVTGLLVAGLALYLIMIAANLHKISKSLDTVYGAVAGIAGQVKPAPAVVGAIADDVGAIQSALHGLIDLATSAPPPAPAAPAPAPAAMAPSAAPAPAAAAASASAPRRPLRAARLGGRPNLPPPVHRRS
jgi:hypothetical protein